MIIMRKIIFSHSTGWGEHNKYTEEVEFENDVKEEEINDEFEQWVWGRISDSVTWYDKQ